MEPPPPPASPAKPAAGEPPAAGGAAAPPPPPSEAGAEPAAALASLSVADKPAAAPEAGAAAPRAQPDLLAPGRLSTLERDRLLAALKLPPNKELQARAEAILCLDSRPSRTRPR